MAKVRLLNAKELAKQWNSTLAEVVSAATAAGVRPYARLFGTVFYHPSDRRKIEQSMGLCAPPADGEG